MTRLTESIVEDAAIIQFSHARRVGSVLDDACERFNASAVVLSMRVIDALRKK